MAFNNKAQELKAIFVLTTGEEWGIERINQLEAMQLMMYNSIYANYSPFI